MTECTCWWHRNAIRKDVEYPSNEAFTHFFFTELSVLEDGRSLAPLRVAPNFTYESMEPIVSVFGKCSAEIRTDKER